MTRFIRLRALGASAFLAMPVACTRSATDQVTADGTVISSAGRSASCPYLLAS